MVSPLVANSCREAPVAFPSRVRDLANLIGSAFSWCETGTVATKCGFKGPNACIFRTFVAQLAHIFRPDCRKLGCFQCCIYGGRESQR